MLQIVPQDQRNVQHVDGGLFVPEGEEPPDGQPSLRHQSFRASWSRERERERERDKGVNTLTLGHAAGNPNQAQRRLTQERKYTYFLGGNFFPH